MLLWLLVLCVAPTFSVFSCPDKSDPLAPGTRCGYSVPGGSPEPTGHFSLRTSVEVLPYVHRPNSATYFCIRTLLEVPACDPSGKRGIHQEEEDDHLSIRIPGVIESDIPCHNNRNGPYWGITAWKIPPVSNLKSHLDITFYSDGIGTLKRNWGAGISHAYITTVRYTDAGKAQQYEHAITFTGPANTFESIPEVCDPGAHYDTGTLLFDTYTLHDFWKTCPNLWYEIPADSLWNTQTPESLCYCAGNTGAPYIPPNTGIPNTVAQYFWWFGKCDQCYNGQGDPRESRATFLPPNNFDSDFDGVPDNCDRCPGFDDGVDSDADGVPDSCDVCKGGEDKQDVNDNKIPDACDLCVLAPTGCGPDATCTNTGDAGTFICDCDPGFRIDLPVFSEASFVSAFYGLITRQEGGQMVEGALIDWINDNPSITSSDAEDLDVQSISDAVDVNEITIEFILLQKLTTTQVDQLFVKMLGFINSEMATCETCGGYTLSGSWKHLQNLDSNGHVVTAFTISITRYAVAATQDTSTVLGCVQVGTCDYYLCDDHSVCYDSLSSYPFTMKPNQRLCVCDDGYTGDRVLVESEIFPGCKLDQDVSDTVNECLQYGCKPPEGGEDLVEGICSRETNTLRLCSCPEGHETPDQESGEVLEPDEVFSGCARIDHCAGDPCGDYSVCENLVDGFSCTCEFGYFDATKDGKHCTDPCELDNGSCQDLCISPEDEQEYSCACRDPNARLSSDNLYCTCKYGFFGDGLNCTKREACAANALAGPFLSDPEAQDLGEFEKPSRVCTGYHENSCCRLSADVFDPDVYLYVAGNDVCRSLLENFFCSLCDPGQTFLEFSSDYLIINVCADYCQQMFEACSSAYPADDESVPHQYLTTNYHEPFHFCEEALLKIFPFTNNSVVSLGVDARVNNKGECFSGAGRPSSSFVLLFGAVLVLILSELFITT